MYRSHQSQILARGIFEPDLKLVVVNGQGDKRRDIPDLSQDLRCIFGSAVALAEKQGPDQLAAHLERRDAPEPRAGNIPGQTYEGLAALAADPLRPRSMRQLLNILRQQREDRRLREHHESLSGNGSKQ